MEVHGHRTVVVSLFGAGLASIVVYVLFGSEILYREWLTAGAVYVISAIFVLAWLRGDRTSFRTALVASVLALSLSFPVTVYLQSQAGALPTGFQSWVLATHVRRTAPIALVFALGAATRRRERYAVVLLVLAPSAFDYVDYVLGPVIDGTHTSWESTLVSLTFWLLIRGALGGVLFVVGRNLYGEVSGAPFLGGGNPIPQRDDRSASQTTVQTATRGTLRRQK